MIVTYNARLVFSCERDKIKIVEVLKAHKHAVNSASQIHFGSKKNSIIELHSAFYRSFRTKMPNIPAQVVIAAQRECLSQYRSIKSNKHILKKPPSKKSLRMRLDKSTFSYKKNILSLISLEKRVKCSFELYPRLREYLSKYRFCDPLVFEKSGEIWMALSFEIPTELAPEHSACGIDLGKRMAAVTSEGHFFQDKKFNKEIRQLRFTKRRLQSKGTKSARRHLKQVCRKEKSKNKNQSHILSKAILTLVKAPVIALENLTGIKKKKHAYQNKNSISQVPFYQLKMFLRYKAPFYRKTVISVNPRFTSQIDHRSQKREGLRKGRRFYGADGIVIDADFNASVNIAIRSKLPVSYPMILDGQAKVTSPIAYKSYACER